MNDKVTFELVNAAVPPDEFGKTDEDGYENAANYAVKVMLGAARRDPIAFKDALDQHRANPLSSALEGLLSPDERKTLIGGQWGLTGFQWGWAVQTVAYLLEQPPLGNPAIFTFGVPQ